jgi:hypothetical protein
LGIKKTGLHFDRGLSKLNVLMLQYGMRVSGGNGLFKLFCYYFIWVLTLNYISESLGGNFPLLAG